MTYQEAIQAVHWFDGEGYEAYPGACREAVNFLHQLPVLLEVDGKKIIGLDGNRGTHAVVIYTAKWDSGHTEPAVRFIPVKVGRWNCGVILHSIRDKSRHVTGTYAGSCLILTHEDADILGVSEGDRQPSKAEIVLFGGAFQVH